ncbi:MAG: hypothetical protein IRY95_02820 [Clostridia bacterium]|nr:hypothetical protein [Clostridia bacterium]
MCLRDCLVGLVTDRPWPNGFVLGGFLFFAARREATGLRLARWHRLWSPPPALARGAVAVRVLAVPGSLRVAAALRYLAADSYVVFVVLDERGRAVGVVDEGLLREEASSGRSAVSLREVVQRGGGGL